MSVIDQQMVISQLRDLRILDGIKACIKTYEAFLNESCKKLKWRDLTGPEKIRLFLNIDISVLFPYLEAKEKIRELWRVFFELIQKLHVEDSARFAKEWVR